MRSGSDADTPARRRRARFQLLRRPQHKERQARIHGGKLQPLAGFQIELIDDAGDGGRRARTQRFLHGPERVFAMRGLDQKQTARIKSKRADAVAVRTTVIAQSVGRQNEDDRPSIYLLPPFTLRGREGEERGQAGEQRHQEAEGGRSGAFVGYDLMQSRAR